MVLAVDILLILVPNLVVAVVEKDEQTQKRPQHVKSGEHL